MDPILKLKSALLSTKHFYSNICIDGNDNDVIKEENVKDDLEKKCIEPMTKRYGHYRNISRLSSSSASS